MPYQDSIDVRIEGGFTRTLAIDGPGAKILPTIDMMPLGATLGVTLLDTDRSGIRPTFQLVLGKRELQAQRMFRQLFTAHAGTITAAELKAKTTSRAASLEPECLQTQTALACDRDERSAGGLGGSK